jgi:hypothetical protein
VCKRRAAPLHFRVVCGIRAQYGDVPGTGPFPKRERQRLKHMAAPFSALQTRVAWTKAHPYDIRMPKKVTGQAPRKVEAMSRFELKIPQTLLQAVEDWAARQPSKPNKSEAVRRLLEYALQQQKNAAKK